VQNPPTTFIDLRSAPDKGIAALLSKLAEDFKGLAERRSYPVECRA
jgi:hypothetical protein